MATARKLAAAELAGALRRQASARVASPSGRIWLALGTVYLLWGSTYLGIKYSIATIPPLLMGSVRFLVAGGILYAVAARTTDAGSDRLGPRQWLAAFVIGAALLVGGNGGVILAEQYAPTGVIGFGGVAFLIGSPGPGHISLFGAALALAAPLCWASGSVFTRHVRLPSRPLVAASMEMLCAGVLFAIASVVTGELGRLHPFSTTSIVALGYLIVFGSLIGFTAYVWLLRSAPLSLVSTYAYVNPVVAVILGTIFLSERIDLRTVVAGGIILAAVALIVVARNRAAAAAAQPRVAL